MKPISMLAGLALFAALPAWLAAQSNQMLLSAPQPAESSSQVGSPPQRPYPAKDHGEFGVFADYFRFKPANTTTNYVGVGARAAFNAHPNLALEGEMSYDFARNFTTTFNNGASTTFVKTSVRPLTGLFGPKLQFGTSGPLRVFVTGKIGFIDFSTSSSSSVSGSNFGNAVAGVGGPGTHLAFYPGGGIEMFAGILGLRVDAGDEVYLNSNTYNNLKVSAGPVLRF